MRKLAHIEIIDNVEPIEGADNIVKINVLGWECVAKKNEFMKGDECVFIEIDSVLPSYPEFEFMESRRYRVKTAKFRKQISQGLVLPIETLSKYIDRGGVNIGDDVTEKLGIVKHDPQAIKEKNENINRNFICKFMMRYKWFRKLFVSTKKSFPSFLKKTDEERIQNIPSKLRKKITCYVTEKMDGQSATFAYTKLKWWHKTKNVVCSRNINLKKPDNTSYWNIVKKHDIFNKLKKHKLVNFCIQGEICGPGIQKNKYKFDEYTFFVFSIFDIKEQKYLSIDNVKKICSKLELEMVPILDDRYILPDTVPELVEYSIGKSIINKNIQREGVVIRSIQDSSFSFKVINPKFLLKHEE